MKTDTSLTSAGWQTFFSSVDDCIREKNPSSASPAERRRIVLTEVLASKDDRDQVSKMLDEPGGAIMAAYDAFDSRFPGGSCSGSSAAGLSQAGSNIPHALCGLRPPVPKVDPSGSDHEAWEDYLVTMSDPKTYGTIAEVHALAYVLDQQIRVFNARGGDDFHCEYVANPNASRSVDLVLSCAHYSYAIEPLSEQGFSRDSSDFRQLRHVPGDGACLFHAVARARGDFSDSAASLLRSMAVDYLRSTGGESRLDGAHGGNGICLRELCVENRAQDRQANVGKKAGSDPSVLYYCDNDRRDLDAVFGDPEKKDILRLRLCHAGSVLRLQQMLEMPAVRNLRKLSLAEVDVRIPWVMDIVATSKAADYLESLTLHCGGSQDFAFPLPMIEWFLPGLIFLHLKDAPCAPYKLYGLSSSHIDRDYADVMPNLRHLSLGRMAGFGEAKWTRNSQTLWLEMFLESRIAKQLLEVDLCESGALADEVRPAFNEAGFFDHSERENYWVRP